MGPQNDTLLFVQFLNPTVSGWAYWELQIP